MPERELENKGVSTILQQVALLLGLKGENPLKVKANGHPTSRLLLGRELYTIHMIRLIDEASRSGVAIELNAHPNRMGIDWRLCKYAKDKGVNNAINLGAHAEDGLKDTFLGVGIA